MSNGDKHPSQKSLGKRPALDTQNSHSRPKRVLPSRSRRGGPGIGSCDVDIIILDAQKRKFESEPLVPANSAILLTTNSRLASSSSTLELGVNDTAFERYFDRPEVSEAYKKQQIIETPEFSLLSEDASVGGRFRPRALEDELADTSDATYEKRHRKYETFEKRQRLREKEKLKHEQYKLKERIDQLRGMDGSAFLALPVAIFSGAPNIASNVDPGIHDLPGIHVNGAALYNEGERRRKEILDTAAGLEERYRVLLPPDRMKLLGKEEKRAATPRVSVDSEPLTQSPEEELESDLDASQAEPLIEKLKLKIKFPSRDVPIVDGQEMKPVSTRRRSSTQLSATPITRPKTRSSLPEFPAVLDEPTVSPVITPATTFQKPSSPITNAEYLPSSSSPQIDRVPPRKRGRKPQPPAPVAVFSDQAQEDFDYDQSQEPIRRMRHRISLSDTAGRESTGGALMTAAIRSSGTGRKTQRTQRHVTAFGTKVHAELDEIRDFEIPDWIRRSVHIMDDASDVPPEGHSDTWFAEQVNGGRHSLQQTAPAPGPEIDGAVEPSESSLKDDLFSILSD